MTGSATLPDLYDDMDKLKRAQRTCLKAMRYPWISRTMFAVFIVGMNVFMLASYGSPTDPGQYPFEAVLVMIAANVFMAWFGTRQTQEAENIAMEGKRLMRDLDCEMIRTRCRIRRMEWLLKAAEKAENREEGQ